MKVALIGLGTMGAPMGLNLLKAGHSVTVHNRSRDRELPLAAAGAQRADSPAQAATAALYAYERMRGLHRAVIQPSVQRLASADLHRQVVTVPPDTLDGSVIGFPGLEQTITDVFVRLSRLDGSEASQVVRPTRPVHVPVRLLLVGGVAHADDLHLEVQGLPRQGVFQDQASSQR